MDLELRTAPDQRYACGPAVRAMHEHTERTVTNRGINPMPMPDFSGPGARSISFVTPDRDVTFEFHCHGETHEQAGMHGRLIVGKGSPGMAGHEGVLGQQVRLGATWYEMA